ncbi:MAG TPA: Ppx/GppA phosphatase family protein [Methanocella sp.]|jgi:exopolyphosphatase/guanosine-5'-triphosphate,3'-diphosphate pyrophosphatase
MSEKQAIIDLGSNTTRMLIIETTGSGAYHLIEDDKGVIRLSEDTIPGGEIRPAALRRAIDAIRLFKGICDYHRVTKITAVATAAVRESSNRDEFLGAMFAETAIRFRVLSREEESYYGYLGVINTTDLTDGLIMDVGGGSIELTVVEGRKPVETTSIPWGALNLSVRFLDRDRPTKSQLEELESFVKGKLQAIPWIESRKGGQLFGIGGTIRTIARMSQRFGNYPFDELHNYAMAPADVAKVYDRLSGTTLEERRDLPGLSRDRADIIIGGMAAANTIIKTLKVSQVRVSSAGLRDGVFFQNYFKEPVVADVTEFSVDNLSRLFRVDEMHAKRVTELSVALFDQLQPVHGLKTDDRRALRAAARLHELGYYFDYGKRFNNTFYHILDNNIFGFTHLDNYRVALVAAHYGANGIKSRSILQNVALDKDTMRNVKKLSVLLGIADGFDRGRRGKVTSLQCHVNKNSVEIRPVHQGDITIELMTIRDLVPYFKKAFDTGITVIDSS